ncbi:MAG: WGR domain-containing protein, partial [bacterium]
ERDIIIMSICYGHDAGGRMLMNFGPINQTGGEKRLNVIFSRARRHMVVVSSIHHHDITNEYNDGANCLRNYLEYAAAVSRGDQATARRVLATLSPGRTRERSQPNRDAVIEEIRQALQGCGYLVDTEVGQSKFRCDLAVRMPNENAYRLAIQIDTTPYYANPNLLERYLLRPGILRAFNWQVAQVLTKDWFHAPDEVLQRLERLLQRNVEEAVAAPENEEQKIPVDADLIADDAATSEEICISAPLPDSGNVKAPPVMRASLPEDEKGTPPLTRYLEFRNGNSAKFWEVTVRQTSYAVRYGRIGSSGQTQVKDFGTQDRAMQEAEKMIREKLSKGYIDAAG